MRFLIDQQLPPLLAGWIAGRGHAAEHVSDIGLGHATDAEPWRYAEANAAVVVTKDEDFAARRVRGDGPSVHWIRIGNATNPASIAWLEPRWEFAVAALREGAPLVEVR